METIKKIFSKVVTFVKYWVTRAVIPLFVMAAPALAHLFGAATKPLTWKDIGKLVLAVFLYFSGIVLIGILLGKVIGLFAVLLMTFLPPLVVFVLLMATLIVFTCVLIANEEGFNKACADCGIEKKQTPATVPVAEPAAAA